MRKNLFCLLLIATSGVLYVLICQDQPVWLPGLRIFNTTSTIPQRVEQKGVWFTYEGFCVWSLNGEEEADSNNSVTLSTQGTVNYLHHVTELCSRWKGPISVAVYAPEHLPLIRKNLYAFRKCDPCVRSHVSWHVFFTSNGQCPFDNDFVVPNRLFNCNMSGSRPGPVTRTSPYPINVGRNIARMKSNTQFIMSIDIELYPSEDISGRFLRMLENESNHKSKRQVWVLPVFEVQDDVQAPRTKIELRSLYMSGKAIPFHKYRCMMCHRIPYLKEWIKFNGDPETLHIFETLKRDGEHGLKDWEPFFIGTCDEPTYDVRLTWEGKQNKMQVALEMCVLDYNFAVLDDAFLVHSPGINKYNSSKEKFRNQYTGTNSKIMKHLKARLKAKFPNATKC